MERGTIMAQGVPMIISKSRLAGATTETLMRIIERRNFIKSTSSLALAGVFLPALAQTPWPTKPVRLIVPLAAGGALDFRARQCRPVPHPGLESLCQKPHRSRRHQRHGHRDEGNARRLHLPRYQR